jgi:hypothetical protein
MNELAERKTFELISQEDIEFLIKYDEYRKRAKVLEDRIKAAADEFLEQRGLDEYKQDVIRIHRTKPYTKKQLDIQQMKDEGVYELYLKDVDVKGSIRIDFDYDD